jgi:hypothetical protein
MTSTGKTSFHTEAWNPLVFEGGYEVLAITDLDETTQVDGIETCVIEERA